jgi:Flp pilus assembly protein TadG
MKLLGSRKLMPTKATAGTDVEAHSDASLPGGTRLRGQSMVEMALLLPLLMILLSVVLEGGLALNAWIRVNTAARDAARFAYDAGRPDQTVNLVLDKLAGVEFDANHEITGSTNIDIFIITATTSSTGVITTWDVNHHYDGGADGNGPKLTQATVQARLNSQGFTVSQSATLTIVEVDFNYTPLLATLVARGTQIPMTSFAMIQRN